MLKKLDLELKNKYLAALRSSAYKQGFYGLRSKDDHYCCLGVLCDIIAPDDWEEAACEIFGDEYILHRGQDVMPDEHLLDDVDTTWYGILSEMNDNGVSFKEIANWIEKNL